MLFSLGHSSFSCSQKAVQRNRGARDLEHDREREMIAGVQDVSSRFDLLQGELRMHLMLDTELQRRCGLPVLVVE